MGKHGFELFVNGRQFTISNIARNRDSLLLLYLYVNKQLALGRFGWRSALLHALYCV